MLNINFNRDTKSQTSTSFNGTHILIDKVQDAYPEEYYIYCKDGKLFSRRGIITYNNGLLSVKYFPKYSQICNSSKLVYRVNFAANNKIDDATILEHMKLGVQIIGSSFQLERY